MPSGKSVKKKGEQVMFTQDLPSIDEAFDEAVALTSKESLADEDETEEEAPEEESETKPEAEADEVKEEAEDKAEAEVEEKFADKPDLDGKSPEELEKIYQDWQKAYTQKRQAEKEEMHKLQERMKELEAKAPKQEKPVEEMNPQEFKEYALAQAKRQVEVERDNAYIESQEKLFYELDPRLDEDNPNFDQALFYSTVGQLTKEREAFEAESGSAYGFDFVGKAKGLIKSYDEAVKTKVQSYLKTNNEKARAKVDKSTKTNPKTQAAKLKKKGGMDLEDAFEEAINEVSGSFGW